MDRFDELYPRYDEGGKEMIRSAYSIAAEALKEHKRSNGNPFIEHPDAVARIAYEEIGLSEESYELLKNYNFELDQDIDAAQMQKMHALLARYRRR